MAFIPNKRKHEQVKLTTQRKRVEEKPIQKERENFEELSL